MKKFFKRLLEKRNLDPRSWIPLNVSLSGGGIKTREAITLSQIRRGLGIYADLLMNSKLHAYQGDKRIEGDPIIELWEKPNNWQSKFEFITQLVSNYWLNGNFSCYIFDDNKGNITGLGPFPPESIYAYARGETVDASNPIHLQRNGFYYLSSFKDDKGNSVNNRISSDSIWHIKNIWGKQTTDQLNGVSMLEAYTASVEFGSDILDTAQHFSETGLIPPAILKGITEENYEDRKKLRDELEEFFKGKGQFLTLQDGVELNALLAQNPANLLMGLFSVSSCVLSRLLNMPVNLIDREDGGTDSSGQGQKESHRFFIKTAGRSFLKMISNKLSELSDNHLEFAWRSSQFADLRESNSLVPLVQENLLSKERAALYLED